MKKDFDIEKFMDLKGYEETRKDRRKGANSTQEFFTPYSIVKRMCEKIDDSLWADPKKTILEPCFGNGQFIVYIIYNRLMHGVPLFDTLLTLRGVELMPDNVAECKERVFKLLDGMEVPYDRETVQYLLDRNLVCADFFKWDFKKWQPIPEYKPLELF